MPPSIVVVATVDDDRRVRESVRSVLESAGYEAITFESAETFLFSGALSRVACVIVDVRLPGMDGYEVAAAIRTLERTRRTPIIFMSAEDDRRTMIRDGAAETYLRKPLEPDVLRPTLAHLLANRASP